MARLGRRVPFKPLVFQAKVTSTSVTVTLTGVQTTTAVGTVITSGGDGAFQFKPPFVVLATAMKRGAVI